jgi:hypothetical protein
MYQYTPFEGEELSIRLLEVLSTPEDDHGRCRLVKYGLNKRPAYNALSYAWGNREGEYYVSVDGEDLKVTENLLHFLKQYETVPLRERTRLWIDAICINQANISERNHQVQLMYLIYNGAEMVLYG